MDDKTQKILCNCGLIMTACVVILTCVMSWFAFTNNSRLDRMEDRFNDFADTAQPVFEAGGAKAVEAISGIDAAGAAEQADSIIQEGAGRAARWLNRDRDGTE